MADSSETVTSTSHPLRRVRALWAWGWRHRHRFSDWAFAVMLFPFVWGAHNEPPSGLVGPALHRMVRWDDGIEGLLFHLAFSTAIAGLVSLAVLFRRGHPQVLLTLAAALLLLFGDLLPIMFALYSHAVWSPHRWSLAPWAVFAVVVWSLPIAGPERIQLDTFVVAGVMIGLPLTVGLWVGTRRQLIVNLRDRTERLERERHLLAERATSAERTRIAREMHDVVAHRVSMMVLHAGGLEVSTTDARTAEIAGTIRTTGREALGELRGILGVLRDDGAAEQPPTGPQPVLADLERLFTGWRATGMEVRRSDTGWVRDLPARVERTAYRVIQEALTNAAKHAPGADVRVRLDFGSVLLTVLVTNGPAPPRTGPSPPESGYGLTGLAERVTLAGGTLESGATFDGGWRLRADLPVDVSSDPDSDTDTGPRDAPHHGSEREHGDSNAGREADPDDAGRR